MGRHSEVCIVASRILLPMPLGTLPGSAVVRDQELESQVPEQLPSSSQSQPLSCGFLVGPRYVGEVLETDTLVDPKALRRGFPKTQLFCRAYRRGHREELAG